MRGDRREPQGPSTGESLKRGSRRGQGRHRYLDALKLAADGARATAAFLRRSRASEGVPVVTAILAAAGFGRRLGCAKALFEIAGRPLIWYSLQVFEHTLHVDQVVLVVGAEDRSRAQDLVRKEPFSKVTDVVVGGKERGDSVWSGLKCVDPRSQIVLIHDGARPMITRELVLRAIHRCISTGSAVLAVPVHDTVRRVVHEFATKVVDRKQLYLIQTPQAFRFDTIIEAYHRGLEMLEWPTDDAALVENLGEKINLVEGSAENIKITTPDDILLAEAILALRRSRSGGEGDLDVRRDPGV